MHSQRVTVSAPAGDQAPIVLNSSDKINNGTVDTEGTPPTYLYAEALSIAAMIEEDLGNTDSADRLFQEAVDFIKQTGFRILLRTISSKYAKVLEARGAYDRAVKYHQLAASTNSNSALSG